MTYSELLQQLTVESQDNGEVFTRTNRLERIKSLLHDSSYELLYAGKLAILYGKKGVTPAKARLLVSSHIDTVYTHCFCEETDTHWKIAEICASVADSSYKPISLMEAPAAAQTHRYILL